MLGGERGRIRPLPEVLVPHHARWRLHRAALAGGAGGAGLSFAEQIVLYEELARAGAPRLVIYFISLHHTPATLLEWGTEAQRKRHLPAILSGDEIWCQGFSEPNAGSDLASLPTRAERRGSVYVVNGQKTWSSSAHLARYCLLLARTDSAGPKQKGISYFILDLESHGVTRRPIKMLTGGAHFNEIFPRRRADSGREPGWRGGRGLERGAVNPGVRARPHGA